MGLTIVNVGSDRHLDRKEVGLNPIYRRILWGALLFCGILLATRALPTFSSSTVPFLHNSGVGYDPLTANEAERALTLALGKQEQEGVYRNERAIQPLEILSVERYDAPKGSQSAGSTSRQGDVYLYEYATDTLIHSIIDVESGAVREERLRGVQLPLTVREKARALQIIRGDADLWSALAERYRLITGETLTATEQLQTKVSLFLGESMPDQVNAAAQQCGQHRCAQVLLFTVDHTLLEALPIVDLSRGKVIQILSDSWGVPATVATAETTNGD